MDIPSFLALNDGHGLLDLSEENLEKMHKVARRLREKKCRLTGPQENLTDLLNRFVTFFIILNSWPFTQIVSDRLNIHSDPVVQLYEPVVICSKCGGHGHSKASCLYMKAMDTSTMSAEDVMFWTFVHPCDRPESLREDWSVEDMSVDTSFNLTNSASASSSSESASVSSISDTDTQFPDTDSEDEFLAP